MKIYRIFAGYFADGTTVFIEDSATVKREAVALSSEIYNEAIGKGAEWIKMPTIHKVVNGEVTATLTIPGGREYPVVTGDWGAKEWES